MTELEKAFSGEQFNSLAEDVCAFQMKVKDLCFEFNHTLPSDKRRNDIIRELVTGYNPYVFIESGFQCAFGKTFILTEWP
ncbi:MAG: hypothetical protein IJI24_07000 [Lachnospiraceae bacterium]|nr:hypothetical protein [Lachnospiraceae bacterium]